MNHTTNQAPKKKEKRGRKPKNNISLQKPPPGMYDKSHHAKIVRIKPSKQNEEIQGYDNQVIPETIHESSTTPIVCWNCNHVTHEFIGIPVERANNVYIVTGTCCSHGCAARYIFDTYETNDLWTRYTLLNMYYNERNGTTGKKVVPAPHKHNLIEYGGSLTREEYIGDNVNSSVVLPPIIPIDNYICDLDKNVHCKSLGDLKLYRKKPVKTNQVLDKMGNV